MAVINITKDIFENEVVKSDVPVLVDFWAPWCGPCKMLGPIIDEIGGEVSDIKVCKVNIDEQMELASKYGVMSIPTIMMFKGGEVVKKEVGAKSKAEILKMIRE